MSFFVFHTNKSLEYGSETLFGAYLFFKPWYVPFDIYMYAVFDKFELRV